MAHTERTYYLDDECLAYVEEMKNGDVTSTKSQAVRLAIKKAAEECREHGIEALPPDEERRYTSVLDGAHEGENEGHERDVVRDESDTGGGSHDRRTVPNPNHDRGGSSAERGGEDSPSDPPQNGDDGRHSLFSSLRGLGR